MAEALPHLEVEDPVYVPLLMIDRTRCFELGLRVEPAPEAKEDEAKEDEAKKDEAKKDEAKEDEPSVATCDEKLSIQELAKSKPSKGKIGILADIKVSVPTLPTLSNEMNATYAKASEKIVTKSPKSKDDPEYTNWINAKYAELSLLPRENPPPRPRWAKLTRYTVPITEYRMKLEPCLDALEKLETMCLKVEERFIDKVLSTNTDAEDEIHRLTNSEYFDLWLEAKNLQYDLHSYNFEGKRLFVDFHCMLVDAPRGLRCNYFRRLDTCMSLLSHLLKLNGDKKERLHELKNSTDPTMYPSLGFAASKTSPPVRFVVPKMPSSISDATRKRALHVGSASPKTAPSVGFAPFKTAPPVASASPETARPSRSEALATWSSFSSAVPKTSLSHSLTASKTSKVFRFSAPETSKPFRFDSPKSSAAFRFSAPETSTPFVFPAPESLPAFGLATPETSPTFKCPLPKVSTALECASSERSTESYTFTSKIYRCTSDGAPESSVESLKSLGEEYDSSSSDEANIDLGDELPKPPLGIPPFDARRNLCIVKSVSETEFERNIEPCMKHIREFKRQCEVMQPKHTYPFHTVNIETCGELRNLTPETLEKLNEEMKELVDCLEFIETEGKKKHEEFETKLENAPSWVRTNLMEKLEECAHLIDELLALNKKNKKKVQEALFQVQVKPEDFPI